MREMAIGLVFILTQIIIWTGLNMYDSYSSADWIVMYIFGGIFLPIFLIGFGMQAGKGD